MSCHGQGVQFHCEACTLQSESTLHIQLFMCLALARVASISFHFSDFIKCVSDGVHLRFTRVSTHHIATVTIHTFSFGELNTNLSDTFFWWKIHKIKIVREDVAEAKSFSVCHQVATRKSLTHASHRTFKSWMFSNLVASWRRRRQMQRKTFSIELNIRWGSTRFSFEKVKKDENWLPSIFPSTLSSSSRLVFHLSMARNSRHSWHSGWHRTPYSNNDNNKYCNPYHLRAKLSVVVLRRDCHRHCRHQSYYLISVFGLVVCACVRERDRRGRERVRSLTFQRVYTYYSTDSYSI